MPSARPRSTANVQLKDGFMSGAVVKITLVNFMTYDMCVFEPDPRMNVIVGPNGSGKSTILCAICLGLGGKPVNVGRASAVGDYVKHGCQMGSVEIELCNVSGANFVVFREIHRNGSSTWKLNKKQATQKMIDELMVKLNIQMKNLCQFLPQDRVAEFVKMTPQDLLESTEKAAGDPGLWEDHCRLKNCQNQSQELQSTVTQLQEELATQLQQKSRLEQRVNTYKAREKHLVSIELLEKKKSWLEYNVARDQFNFAKSTKDRKLAEFKVCQEMVQPLQSALDKIKREVAECDQKAKQLASGARDNHKKALDKMQAVVVLSDRSAEIVEDYRAKIAAEEKRKILVNTMNQQLQALQRELENMPHNDQLIPQLEALNEEIKDQIKKLNAIQENIGGQNRAKRSAQQEHQTAQNEKNKIQDVKRIRMDMLRQRHRDSHAATLWLRENADKFKKTIYEPIVTVVNLKNPSYAKYLERQIPFKDMIAFVCEDADDLEIFLSNVRDKQNLRVNAVLAPDVPSSSFVPATPLQSIKKWGFHSYLKDVVDAPEAVLAYLCKQYRIHDIPIGNNDTKKNIERVLNDVRLNSFYTENHLYRINVSKYGDRVRSTTCSELEAARLLIANLDVARLQELENILQRSASQIETIGEMIQGLQEEERQTSSQTETLRIKKKELTQQRDARKNQIQKIESKRRSIQNSEEEQLDLEEEKKEANRNLLKIVHLRRQRLKEHRHIVKDLVTVAVKRAVILCKQRCADAKRDEISKELRDCGSNLPALEQEVAICQENVSKLQVRARSLLEAAKKKTGIRGQELPANLEEKFATLPDTLEEVNTEIRKSQAQVDCLQHPEFDNSMEDYKLWERRIEKLEQSFQLKTAELANFQTNLEKVHDRWLVPLRNLLQQVNVRFSEYFKSLGCSGEVDIKIGENEKDYANYGISIRVTYRDSEPLRELTQFYQSGGERSVATILYLLALQAFIKLPFCCVDEINQGMDSTNERRVFQIMTQAVCTANLAQYFLLTPKLLPNMEFAKNVTCQTIVSGTLFEANRWNNNLMCERRAGLEE